MYTVRSGRTGFVAAKELLSHGKSVKIFTRDVSKLKEYTEKGAQVAQVNGLSDVENLAKAFSNSKVAYVLIAPGMIPSQDGLIDHEKKEIDNLVEALKKAENLENIVALSSWGGDKKDGTGQIKGMYYMEQEITKHLKDKVKSIVYLRACSFLENHESMIKAFKAGWTHGFVSSAFVGDLKIPQICTLDIGMAAAKVMLDIDNYKGVNVIELQGPEDISMLEITKVLSEHYNIPAKYNQQSLEEFGETLQKYGFTKSNADLMTELYNAINTGHIRKLQPRSKETTTPTNFKQFLINFDKEQNQ